MSGPNECDEYPSLVVASWVLRHLSCLSPFEWLKRWRFRKSGKDTPACHDRRSWTNRWTDIYVMGCTALSALLYVTWCATLCLIRLLPPSQYRPCIPWHSVPRGVNGQGWLIGLLSIALGLPWLAAGALRILEILVVHFRILILDPSVARAHEEPYGIESHERSLVLAMANYATIVLWFAFTYRTLPFLFQQSSELQSCLGGLYASLATMSLFGADNLRPITWCGRGLLLAHLCVAIVMTLVVLAHAVGTLQSRTLEDIKAGLKAPPAQDDLYR